MLPFYIFKYAITRVLMTKGITRSLFMMLEKPNKHNKYLVKY